mmetsp:Transcript_11899/g.16169  ORF Transcript_11899/g.16169 Transcript_11899/m.16169 type:complete len:109 (+) Transcript_11899:2605-2931(+)
MNEAKLVTGTPKRSSKNATPVRSVKSGKSSQVTSPVPNKMNMSMLQTADEASGLENSFVLSVEYERRDFNEIDILGTLDRDDKGNIIVPTDEKTGSKRSFDKEGRPIN